MERLRPYTQRTTSSRGRAVRRWLLAFLLTGFSLTLAPVTPALAATNGTGVTPNSGPIGGGTKVTIASPIGGTRAPIPGANFQQNDLSVTFGGVPATHVTRVDNFTVTATTPAHAAGAVNVSVSDGTGAGPLVNSFTYTNMAPTINSISPSSGVTSGGTTVTITGTNLASATSVTFGGAAGTITSAGATQIAVMTPPHAAGKVDVVVTTRVGNATGAGAYTFTLTNPIPIISAIQPPSGTTAGGTIVTITGTNLNAASRVAFGGVAATITTRSINQITVTTPAHAAGAVTVVLTTPGGTATVTNGYTYSGSLAITAPPNNFAYAGSITGDQLTLQSSFAVSVNDATGSASGWNLQASIAPPTTGTDTIAAGNHTIASVSLSNITGIAPNNGIAYPLALPTQRGKIFSATAGSGAGNATMTFHTRLLVPPHAAAGIYAATLTVTIAAGP